MPSKQAGLGIVAVLGVVIVVSIVMCRRPASVPAQVSQPSGGCSARQQELRIFEKAIEGKAQLFTQHASAMLSVAALQFNNPAEFLNAKVLGIYSAEITDTLRSASALAEIYGNVCSDSDRARIEPTTRTQISYIAQDLEFLERDIDLIASHTTVQDLRARAVQMSQDLASSVALLQSLKSKLE